MPKGKPIVDCHKENKACGPRDKSGNLLGVICKGKGDSTYGSDKGICGGFVCLNHKLTLTLKESKGIVSKSYCLACNRNQNYSKEKLITECPHPLVPSNSPKPKKNLTKKPTINSGEKRTQIK